MVASRARKITALGMRVARTLRKKRKMTATTSPIVMSRVVFDVLDRSANGLCPVRQHVNGDGWRNIRPQARQGLGDRVYGLNDIGARRLVDDQQDALAAFQRWIVIGHARKSPRADLAVLHALHGAAEIPYPNCGAS